MSKLGLRLNTDNNFHLTYLTRHATFYDIEYIADLVEIKYDLFEQILKDCNGTCFTDSRRHGCYFSKEDEIKINEFMDQINIMLALTEWGEGYGNNV